MDICCMLLATELRVSFSTGPRKCAFLSALTRVPHPTLSNEHTTRLMWNSPPRFFNRCRMVSIQSPEGKICQRSSL
eukprot:2776088-Pleurochrysis_carterae.AAC.1